MPSRLFAHLPPRRRNRAPPHPVRPNVHSHFCLGCSAAAISLSLSTNPGPGPLAVDSPPFLQVGPTSSTTSFFIFKAFDFYRSKILFGFGFICAGAKFPRPVATGPHWTAHDRPATATQTYREALAPSQDTSSCETTSTTVDVSDTPLSLIADSQASSSQK